MIKLLFFINTTLSSGGAEKVLRTLVNNMDQSRFDITVITSWPEDGGKYLAPGIHYRSLYPARNQFWRLVSRLEAGLGLTYRMRMAGEYDIEIAYLEGPAARIVSGCPDPDTKLVSWIHCTIHTSKEAALGYRHIKEARTCYGKMDTMAFVSQKVRDAFLQICPYTGQSVVLYNTNESDEIISRSSEPAELPGKNFCWCGVGKVVPIKGFDRMIRIQKRLADDGYQAHLCILGEGPQKDALTKLAIDCGVADSVTFLGYQTNPYKYVSKCDLFVCASFSEGFSTAATEALIVGTPVCTVEVSGMKEMLGEHNEWGIVTENDEQALYHGIKRLLDDPQLLAHYKEKAAIRGKTFSTENTVRAVENMLLNL